MFSVHGDREGKNCCHGVLLTGDCDLHIPSLGRCSSGLFRGLDQCSKCVQCITVIIIIQWHPLFPFQEHMISWLMKASWFLIAWVIKCPSKFLSWTAAGDCTACTFYLAIAVCPFPQKGEERSHWSWSFSRCLSNEKFRALIFFFSQSTLASSTIF